MNCSSASCLSLTIEALPGGVGGGAVPVPLFPSKNGLVPQKRNIDFLCSLFPKIACVPLFSLFLGLCSPVPLNKLLVPLFPKTPGRASLFVDYIYDKSLMDICWERACDCAAYLFMSSWLFTFLSRMMSGEGCGI